MLPRSVPLTLSLSLSICVAVAPLAVPHAEACTSIVVGRGATKDGSTMVTYNADSHELYGALRFSPGGSFGPGAVREIHDWDSGAYVGPIPQAPRTYSVVGNMNEHQLVIGESTFGGREELVNPKGGLDYGSLIYVTLERARTAREAIDTMARLVAEHGYRSSGESFSIADTKEAWVMELIGKGPGRKGAVWVARKLPENAVSAHANQARIRTFPLNDKTNTLYSPDVITFAREMGYFKGKDQDFSFADAYAPADWESLRFCEARVWRVFDRVAPSQKLPTDFIHGKPGAKPLPLWVVPDKKLTVPDAQALMRDHFEGTEFDLTVGVGAGPYNVPYRWRPLTWEVDGVTYLNERSVATQQTGFSFVSQSRAWLPAPIGGVLWFGVDDTASSVYVPIYAGVRDVHRSLAEGTATLHRFSWDSAFWVFNWVANQAYARYRDIIQDVRQAQGQLEGSFFDKQAATEDAAMKLHAQSPELARRFLTDYSLARTEETVARWRRLGEELLVKYMDGNVKDALGKVLHPPYPEAWYRRIAAESGDRLRVKTLPGEKPKPDPKGRHVFKSREELGPLEAAVPKEFPFTQAHLVLIPGTAQCGQLPRCCLSTREDATTKKLVAVDSAAPKPAQAKAQASSGAVVGACGEPGVLVRVPRDERRLPSLDAP